MADEEEDRDRCDEELSGSDTEFEEEELDNRPPPKSKKQGSRDRSSGRKPLEDCDQNKKRKHKNSTSSRGSSTNEHRSKSSAEKAKTTGYSNASKDHAKLAAAAKKNAEKKTKSTRMVPDPKESDECNEDFEETQRTSNRFERDTCRSATVSPKSTGEMDDEMDNDDHRSATGNDRESEEEDADWKNVVDKQQAQLLKLQNELRMARTKESFSDGSSP